MPRKRQPIHLVSYAEISKRTGITYGTLRVWKTRGRMPEPDFVVGNSPAWYPEHINPWIHKHSRLESSNNEKPTEAAEPAASQHAG